MKPEEEPDILLRLRWLPGESHDPPRLKRALKRMLRAYGLRCVAIWWQDQPEPSEPEPENQ